MSRVRCPKCEALLQVASPAGGKLVKCPKCATVLRLGGDPADDDEAIAPRPKAGTSRGAAHEEDREEREPRRRERDDDDDEPRRHRRPRPAPVNVALIAAVAGGV